MRILIITGGRIDEDFALSLLKKEKFEHMIVVDGALALWDKVEKNPNIACHFDHLVGDFDTQMQSPKSGFWGLPVQGQIICWPICSCWLRQGQQVWTG